MRDVENGYIIRYLHANVASFFFIFVYAHIGRNIYYGSFKSPRTLVWSIGVIILILMMAIFTWPNWKNEILTSFIYNSFSIGIIPNQKLNIFSKEEPCTAPPEWEQIKPLPFNKSRTKATLRIGPHNKEVIDIIICGMLGDWWVDKISGKNLDSYRFNIEQSIINSAYIHNLTLILFKSGYCARPFPTAKPVEKTFKNIEPSLRFNYRLTLFTFSSFFWIYEAFYSKNLNHSLNGYHPAPPAKPGTLVKKVPFWIDEFLSPAQRADSLIE